LGLVIGKKPTALKMPNRAPLLPTMSHANPDARAVLRGLVLLVVIAIGVLAASVAKAAADNPSGLPLPRFATTRSTPINVRVGPGTRYAIAWVYVKAGTPVEIVQEFDTWRKIRDVDGSEGWVHQNLLSGKRAGIAAPWRQGEQIPLLSQKGATDRVRAYLGPGFRVEIKRCDGAWCEVSAAAQNATYSGFLPQSELWGVYQGEAFD
jgi:SH3-like domain-containing protein